MKRVVMTLLSIALLSGCSDSGGGGDGGKKMGSSGTSCPVCTASTTDDAYGSLRFDAAGNDSAARNVVAQCPFQVSGPHNGGAGNTLQIIGCSSGVELVWAFQSFSAYRVSNGWLGQTDRGIRIGDSRAVVQTKDPRLPKTGAASLVFDDGTTRIEANFAGDTLEELIVGRFFRR